MSGDISVFQPGGADEVVLSSGQTVPMQMLQQIYREVTGKSERMSRRFSVNHHTQFQDLENLNAKVNHLLEQYNVEERSCSVTFFHGNDSTERYSSFDRARAMEVASLSPLENIQLEYNFLIILPIAKKPQAYKVLINVTSRVAIAEKMKDKSGLEQRIFSALGEDTGGAIIEYVDYAVARNIMDSIAQWFDGLDQEKGSELFVFLKKWSFHFDWILRYATATILSVLFLSAFARAPHDLSPLDALRYGAIAFFSVFILSGLTYHLGGVIERSVDAYYPASYLKITRGDERVIAAYFSRSKRRIAMMVWSLLSALALNLVGSWLAVKLHLV